MLQIQIKTKIIKLQRNIKKYKEKEIKKFYKTNFKEK